MKKWQWALIILLIIPCIYLLICKALPSVGATIDDAVGPQISGLTTGIYLAVNNSPIWQQYDIWIAGVFFLVIGGLVVYKGRDLADSIRGVARVRATDGRAVSLGAQREPAEPEQQPVPTPTPVVKEVEKEQPAT